MALKKDGNEGIFVTVFSAINVAPWCYDLLFSVYFSSSLRFPPFTSEAAKPKEETRNAPPQSNTDATSPVFGAFGVLVDGFDVGSVGEVPGDDFFHFKLKEILSLFRYK